jgi:proteasome lid subunit RPN8/RPN11
MLRNPWDYSLAVYREDWTPLAQARVDPDWEPALEWVRLSALNEGRSLSALNNAEVRPIWTRGGGAAFSGFRVAIETEGQPREAFCDFPAQYFRDLAQQAAGPLIEAGRLAVGDVFRYLLLATAPPRDAGAAGAPAFTVRDVTPPPTLVNASLLPLLGQSVTIGEPAPHEAPAIVPQHVLDEIAELTKQAAPLETGGALVGHLFRDARARQVFTRVTAQLPAKHTEASAVRLMFTADTWSSLRHEIGERGYDELMVGWWHSHPVREWCRLNQCPEREHDACALANDIFSEHDRAVHRTVFAGAHAVALVANDVSPAAVRFSAYGWSLGMLQARSVVVVRAPAS